MSALREAREASGLSQRDICKKLKRGKNFVSCVESGERSLEVCEFIDYAKALKIEPTDLFDQLLK